MMEAALTLILTAIAAICAIVQTIYAIVTFHAARHVMSDARATRAARPFGRRQFLMMAGLSVTSWGAAASAFLSSTRSLSRRPAEDRDSFSREVVHLTNLIGDGPPTLIGKHFSKCLVLGPGFLKQMDNNVVSFCAIPDPRVFMTVPEGSAAVGAILFSNCSFIQCYFDHITMIGTPTDISNLSRALDVMSLDDWKTRNDFP